MQYSVPQFVEVEDKIIGPLTLKQFLILVVGAVFGFMYWSIFKASVPFFLLVLPTAAIFVGLAFGKFNGRPVFSTFPLIFRFFLTSRKRVFKRIKEPTTLINKKNQDFIETNQPDLTSSENRISSLHRLAYILDQKTEEQENVAFGGDDQETFSEGLY